MHFTKEAKRDLGFNLFVIATAAFIFLCAEAANAQKPLSKEEKADTVRLCIINPKRSPRKTWPDTARDHYTISRPFETDTIISVPKKRRWMSIKDEWYIFTYVDTSLVKVHPLHARSCLSPFKPASHPRGGFIYNMAFF